MKNDTIEISVIGAGIMGIMSAYYLQTSVPDSNITLYDPAGFPADNASYIAGGMIAPLSELDHMPETYLQAGYESINLWDNISQTLGNEFEFSAQGSLFISHDEDRHLLERFKSILPQNDDWQTIGSHDITTLEPTLKTQTFKNGLYMKREAHLHPQKVMQTLLKQIQNKKQIAIDIKKEAKKADLVIDCRGMNAQDQDKNIRGVKGEVLIVRNPEFTLSRPLRLMHPRYPLYIVPREDNIFLIGATIIETNNNKNVSLRSGMELMSALYSIHRSFGDAEIIEMKANARPSYPDNLPQIHKDKNIIRCNGLYRHGFLFSPVLAQCVAHHINGKSDPFKHLFWKGHKDEHHSKRQRAYA